jgi:hypothetical protein
MALLVQAVNGTILQFVIEDIAYRPSTAHYADPGNHLLLMIVFIIKIATHSNSDTALADTNKGNRYEKFTKLNPSAINTTSITAIDKTVKARISSLCIVAFYFGSPGFPEVTTTSSGFPRRCVSRLGLLIRRSQKVNFYIYSNPTGVVKPLLWAPLPDAQRPSLSVRGFTTSVGLL